MKRNRGLIGEVGKAKTSLYDNPWSHIFDKHDGMYNHGKIPVRPQITGVTFSGNGWDSSNNTWYWGAPVTVNINGTGLVGLNNQITYEIAAGSSGHIPSSGYWDSSLTGTVAASNDTAQVVNKLKTQRTPVQVVNGSFSFVIKAWLGSVAVGNPDFTSASYDIAAFTIVTNVANINEGDTAYATIAIGGVANTGLLNTRTRTYSNVNVNDFTSGPSSQINYTGVSNHTKYASTYVGTSLEDVLNENNETYYVTFQGYPFGDTSYNTFFGLNDTSFQLIDTSYFDTCDLSATSGNEGDSITATVYAYDSYNATLNVTIESGTGNASAADVLNVPASITLNLTSGNRHYKAFTFTLSRDFLTEGQETFRFKFDKDGVTVGYSSYITINDTTTLSSVTATNSTINETTNNSTTIGVNVSGGVGGQTYTQYYSMVEDSATYYGLSETDFTPNGLSGSYTINGSTNSGSFNIVAAADAYIEGPESFKVALGPSSDINLHTLTGIKIDIQDTSATSNAPEPINEFLRSKDLTGAQAGITTYTYTVNKDMGSTSSRQVPSGYNPRNPNGGLTPSGTRYYWNDWSGDWFDQWGDFYIFNPATQTASYISFANINGSDGTVYTETQTHHSKTFQIKHGWIVQGIFKLDVACTSDESFEFAVGFYGNMGSDGSTQNTDRTYTSAPWGTLHYNYNSQNNTSEYFYVHIIPKNKDDNDTFNIDTTGMFTSVYGNDNLAIWTDPFTHGFTVYFVKGSNSTTGANYDYIANDIMTDTQNYYT